MKDKYIFKEQSRRNVDPFRITFHCFRLPETGSKLVGFKDNRLYTGRYYNGLYEISVDWGRSKPFLIEKKQFEKYFQLTTSVGSLGA